jgi:alanine racemase
MAAGVFERGTEREASPRVRATLDAKALAANYRAISHQVSGLAVLPMIKANAYGHGAEWAAGILAGLPDLYALGVATLEEGSQLRQSMGPRGRRTRIHVFSGTAPWSEDKGHYCERFGLTPVLSSEEDWRVFLKGGWPDRLAYELKFNTGMNRLGIPAALARRLAKDLQGRPASWHPAGVLSHLAMGEAPDAPVSRLQRDRFRTLRSELGSVFSSTLFHLANSSGIWNSRHWDLKGLTDLVRPGLSLYGAPPWKGAPERGITPVLKLEAQVIQLHTLQPGESLGYGATFTASHKTGPVRVAILSAGYADGILRSLSGRAPSGTAASGGGHAWLGGRPTRFLGRVSMDMCAVGAFGDTRVGEFAELLGPNVDVWAQAEAAGTIPYELLTSVSARVQRAYG